MVAATAPPWRTRRALGSNPVNTQQSVHVHPWPYQSPADLDRGDRAVASPNRLVQRPGADPQERGELLGRVHSPTAGSPIRHSGRRGHVSSLSGTPGFLAGSGPAFGRVASNAAASFRSVLPGTTTGTVSGRSRPSTCSRRVEEAVLAVL